MYLNQIMRRRLLPAVAFIVFSLSFLSFTFAQSQVVSDGTSTTAVNFPGTGCTYNWINSNPSIGLPASGNGDIPSFSAINKGNAPIIATITATPANAGFAYILSSIGQLYVINTATEKVITNMPTSFSAYGEVISPDGKFVYITDPGSDEVLSLDASTYAVVNDVSTGSGSSPRGIAISPDGSKIYVANEYPYNTGTVDVINTTTFSILKSIPVGSSPSGIIVSPDGNRIYVANQGSNTVSVIDAATNAVIFSIPLSLQANTLAITHDGSQLYVTGSGSVSVINTATNNIVTTVSVGDNPRGITISPDDKNVYVVNGDSQTLSVINIQNNTVTSTVDLPGGQSPFGVSVTPDGKKVYVVNQNGIINVINTDTNVVTNSITTVTGALSFGNFISAGPGCNSSPVTFTVTVNPLSTSPIITTSPVTGNISACEGMASSSPQIQQFTVKGSNLTSSVTAVAPKDFEVSLSTNNGYGRSVMLQQSAGILANATVYVRSAASAPAGKLSEKVTVSSTGLTSQIITVSGTVNALPTVGTVANQTVNNGSATTAINFTGTANIFDWSNDTPGIGLPISGSGDIPSFTAINTGTTSIKATITVLPKHANLAYVAISNSNSVAVVNTETNQVVRNIAVGEAPYAVTISPDNSRVYVSNIEGRSVSVIDPTTNKVIATIPVGTNPYGMSVNNDGSLVYVANEDSNTVSVISSASNTVVNTIQVGYYPVFTLVSPDGSRLYVTNQDGQSVSVFNTSNNILIKTIQFTDAEPQQMAINAAGSILYVVTMGTSTSNLLVINMANFQTIKSIPVGVTPHGLAITPDGSKIYVPNTGSDDVSVISTQTNSIIATIPIKVAFPAGIAITSDGRFTYVVSEGYDLITGGISVINTAIDQVVTTIPTTAANSFGNFIMSGSDCTGVPTSFTITIKPSSKPTVAATGKLEPLTTVYATPSVPASFIVSGINLSTGIIVTPPAGFEVSIDGTNFSPALTIGTGGTIAATTLYIRLTSTTAVGIYQGNIQLASTGSTTILLAMPNSAVTPAPLTIVADNVNKNYGNAIAGSSGSIAFIASGLQNDETIGTVTVAYGPGSAADAPAGTYTGSAIASAAAGGTFNSQNYKISYTGGDILVATVPLTITADNKSITFGLPTPSLTATYTGFVNGDSAKQLIVQPLLTTTASSSSPVGQYPITASGANSDNYAITYVQGILTILAQTPQIFIPNTFTPNGDGVNDTWQIKNIENYPNCTVDIYDRYGGKVMSSKGYSIPWAGKYNDLNVPTGTYYYLIDTKSGGKPLSGWVAVIR